ncbi:MAG: sugar phosphate isomerase/epimerase [Candidatus Methanomethylophilaceae archaeon]|nr:sugar phosphate isomerase/epimerase [Candidatus Methanomethylophilaceae archaeon]
MNRIGVSSPSFCAYPYEDVLEGISKMFFHWEIVSEADHYLPGIAVSLESLMGSYNMTYSIHAPFNDVNIASLNESFRETSVIELIKVMNIAAELDIKTITIHPGMYSMVVSGLEERSIMAAKRSLRTLDRMAQECGVRLCVENMPGFKFFLGQTAEQLSELLDGTNLPVCLDIGHANTTGQLNEIIDVLGNRIMNVHIHDNDGKQDQHLTIGDGNIDFEDCLKRLSGYGGRYIIECKNLESGAESQNRLTRLL